MKRALLASLARPAGSRLILAGSLIGGLSLSACSGEESTGPDVGSIQVTTSTTGPGLDPDGYSVIVDEATRQSISANGTITISNLDPGNHTVRLSGVGLNCPVMSENPLTVSVTAGGTAQVMFDVVCAYLAYVANQSNVSVVATANNTVVGGISVGGQVRGVAITPDGTFAYVTNRDVSNMSVIETATNTVVAAIDVGGGSRYLAITPDGAFAYVAAGASLQGNLGLYSTVSVIATATNTVVATIADLNPRDLAITPDGAFVYVASEGPDQVTSGDNEVLVIETASNTVVGTISVAGAGAVAITPGGAFVYVAKIFGPDVSVIATATNTVVATISVPNDDVAITPDGAFAYVTGGSVVSVIETASNTVVATVSIANPGLEDIGITPDGAFAYVVEVNFADLWVIETATNTVVATINVGGGPFAVAITPF